MDYHKDTQKLIDRMCAYVERDDFELNKSLAEELILKTYDLFDLPRPRNIVWCVDIFDKDFQWSAESAWSSRSAWSSLSAWSSESLWSAWSALSAWSSGSSRSAGSARSALSSRSSGSSRSALDYDFDYFVMEYEYCKQPDKNGGVAPNENDYKYLEYCELLIQALEAGLGYRVEWEDTLYLVPTPVVKIDEENRFHSEAEPAIRWKGGNELYYLWGVNLEKDLWEKVVNKTITPQELMSIDNTEERMVAIKHYGLENLLDKVNAKTISKTEKEVTIYRDMDNRIVEWLKEEPISEDLYKTLKQEKRVRINELVQIDGLFTQYPRAYFLKFECPSTGRVYMEGVDPEFASKHPNADECMAHSLGLTADEYSNLSVES